MGLLDRILSLFSGFNWVIIPAAILAIIFHEISHGLVAYLLGDKTAKQSGRLSLNPLQHFDVLGFLCMIFFSFGWAKPVPVNPYSFKNKKAGMILVALAGPLSNLIMAFVALFLVNLASGIFESFSPVNSVLVTAEIIFLEFLINFVVLNIGLAVFNLIPVPPLDGSKILFSLLPNSAYGFVLKYENYGMLFLLVLINVPFFSRFLDFLRYWIYIGMCGLFNIIF